MPNFNNTLDVKSAPRILRVFGSAVGNRIEISFTHHVRILNAYFKLNSTATAGNRQMRLHVDDVVGGSGVVFITATSVTQGANEGRHYNFFSGVPRDTAFIDNSVNIPIAHELHLTPDQQITINDLNNVDVLDDYDYNFNYEEIS